ncbi:MAG: Rrf2 family transcriptional regulator [Pseudomonadota bacterium]
MIKPSKKLALALEAVCDIAYNGASEPVQSQDIARRLQLPRRYLEQVMQQMVRAGILRGVRGPRGGYRLARERRRISVADVVSVVQAMDAATAEDDDRTASAIGQAVTQPFWNEVERDVLARLSASTIEDLCREAESRGVSSEAAKGVDFAI